MGRRQYTLQSILSVPTNHCDSLLPLYCSDSGSSASHYEASNYSQGESNNNGQELKSLEVERIVFPVVATIAISLIVPQALPLVGMLMLGNLLRENGKTKRLVEASGKYISDTVIILLCVSVGAKSGR